MKNKTDLPKDKKQSTAYRRSPRRNARLLLVQFVYEFLLTQKEANEILFKQLIHQYLQHGISRYKELLDLDYLKYSMNLIGEKLEELEVKLKCGLDRDIERLDLVSRSILIVGTYELMYRKEIPSKVVINEAVELAKIFADEESFKYVNGVLDKLLQQVLTNNSYE